MADTQGIIKEIKTILSSLLVSSPKSLTVRSLWRDYKNETGQEVPFRKLGFNTFEGFLRSIPDACKVNGIGEYAVVVPVVSENVKHLNEMIMKQKMPKSKYNRGRRSHGVCMEQRNVKPPNKFYKPVNSRDMSQTNNFRHNSDSYNSHLRAGNNYSRQTTNKNNGASSNYCKQKLSNSSINEVETARSVDDHNAGSFISRGNANSGRFEIPYDSNSDDDYEEDYFIDADLLVLSDTEVFVYRSDSEDKVCENKSSSKNLNNSTVNQPLESNLKVNNELKKNINILVSQYPEGIWCSNLAELYEEKWKKALDPNDYGFRSILHMCDAMPDVLQIIRPNRTDWKIFHVDFCVPNTIASFSDPVFEEETLESPLPEIFTKSEEYTYPAYVMKPGDSIPRQWLLPEHKLMEYVDIIVSEVFDPSKFWVQLRDKQASTALSRLMDELGEFYGGDVKYLQLNEWNTCVGLYCAALFLNEYHRAVIVKVFHDETLKVYYIDYGTVGMVSRKHTYLLHKDFSKLPQQAIRARLSNIIPSEQNTMWPIEATHLMLQLVTEKDLVGLLIDVDTTEQILNLVLTDTTIPAVDIHINDVLVDEGLAVIGNEAPICETSTAIVPNVHLYPTFTEIENGIYPCFKDVINLLKLDQTYEIIFRGYFRDPFLRDSNNSLTFTADNCSENNSLEEYKIKTNNSKKHEIIAMETKPSIQTDRDTKLVKEEPIQEKHENNHGKCLNFSESTQSSKDQTSSETSIAITKAKKHLSKQQLNRRHVPPPPGLQHVQPNPNIANFLQTSFSNLNPFNFQHAPPQMNTTVLLPDFYNPYNNSSNPPFLKNHVDLYNHVINFSANCTALNILNSVFTEGRPLHPHPMNNRNVNMYKGIVPALGNKNSIIKLHELHVGENVVEVYVSNKFFSNYCVFNIKFKDISIHILKLDQNILLSSKEVIEFFLNSPLFYKAWIENKNIPTSEFSTKVINILEYMNLYNQVKSYSLPGIFDMGSAGCFLRTINIKDVINVVKKHGSNKTFSNLYIIKKAVNLLMLQIN